MAHYVIIDTNSGFIWGDTHAESAHIACGVIDNEIDRGTEYSYEEVSFTDNHTYAVYTLSAGHFDLLPENYDGQDQDLISSVEKLGRLDCHMARTAV